MKPSLRVCPSPTLAVSALQRHTRPAVSSGSPPLLSKIFTGSAGYAYVLNWDASFADSSRRRNGRAWPITSYVRAATRGIAGSVILGHCGSAIDLAALPRVIAAYRVRGFSFVTVPQLLGMPGAMPMSFPAPTPAATPAPSPDPRPAAGPPRAL